MLRRPVDAFSGPDDPAAYKVADGITDPELVDCLGLQNGTAYYYRAYYMDAAGAWMAAADSFAATPAATYGGDAMDPAGFVRERVEAGIGVEVRRGVLKPSPKGNGKIEVLSAPFALGEGAQFPVVSVHLDSEMPEVRGLGEAIGPDFHKPGGGWTEVQGWLSRVRIGVVGVTVNAIERNVLHRALGRIMRANLGIFYARGFDLIDFDQQQREDSERFNVPLFFSVGTLSCLAPAWVSDDVGEIRDVDVEMDTF